MGFLFSRPCHSEESLHVHPCRIPDKSLCYRSERNGLLFQGVIVVAQPRVRDIDAETKQGLEPSFDSEGQKVKHLLFFHLIAFLLSPARCFWLCWINGSVYLAKIQSLNILS